MAQFHDLTVTDVRKTIKDAVVVTLRPDDPSAFDFTPGQYLTFRRDFDGQEIRRSYSVCTGTDDGVLQVGIKRVDGGAFSTWANTDLHPGERLQAMAPMGQFTTALSADTARHYVGFAGGSGITPILSILRSVLAREPHSRFTLVYANRQFGTIMFRDELEDLKNQHMDRLTLIHVLEDDPSDIDLFTGRLDAAKLTALFTHWLQPKTIDLAFICGPEPMMLAIRDGLLAQGIGADQIKYELFASAQPGRLPQPAARAPSAVQHSRLTVTSGGVSRTVQMAPGQSVLQAALAHDIEAPYACTAGVCSTCRCKVLKGQVEMIANHALEDYEVAQGYVLSCQAHPVSDTVVVDYDQ